MNTKTESKQETGRGLMIGMMAVGITIGVWSFSALMSGLASTGWNVTELLRQYMVSLGMIQEHQTFVSFYTHIKGIEYIIAVAFLGAFPAFFKLVNKTNAPVSIQNS